MKKGFTVVELLGAIVILTILLLITFTSVSIIVRDSKNSVYYKQINSILNAAYDWSLKYPNSLPKTKGDKKYLSLMQLQRGGYVDDFINPKTKEKYPIDLIISIEYTGGNYRYNSKYSKLNGNYLYTVLSSDNNRTNNSIVKPTFTFEDSNVIDNGDGSYHINSELGYPYTYYTPLVRIKDKVINNVMSIVLDNTYEKDGKEVKIDTTKKAIYYNYFIATDENGNSNHILLKIVIDDTESPVLYVPGTGLEEDATEIPLSATEFDLMEGVTCTDNSDTKDEKKCVVTTEGTINFGVEGRNTIIYTAKDPSGRTTSIERIIKVSDD